MTTQDTLSASVNSLSHEAAPGEILDTAFAENANNTANRSGEVQGTTTLSASEEVGVSDKVSPSEEVSPLTGLDYFDGSNALIADFFQSLFELSFDGSPNNFSPNWDYLFWLNSDYLAAAPAGTMAGKPGDKKHTDKLPQSKKANTENRMPRGARFPSGPIPRGQPGLAARRLASSMLARLYYAVAMAEVMVFPHYIACGPADKDRQNRNIAQTIGLDRAVDAGLIESYVICWPAGRFPKTVLSIRLSVPGGCRQRGRALGEMEASLRAWIQAMQEVSGP